MADTNTPDGAQALPADERESLVAELRKHAQTRVEWRVADPTTGSYCIAFGRDWCLDPEHEAREWLRKHRAEFPEGRFVSHEVQRVEIRDPLDEAALEAADMLDRLAAAPPAVVPAEPVAWRAKSYWQGEGDGSVRWVYFETKPNDPDEQPLYATPPGAAAPTVVPAREAIYAGGNVITAAVVAALAAEELHPDDLALRIWNAMAAATPTSAAPDNHMRLLSGLWRHGLPATNRAGQSLQQFIDSVEDHLATKAAAPQEKPE